MFAAFMEHSVYRFASTGNTPDEALANLDAAFLRYLEDAGIPNSDPDTPPHELWCWDVIDVSQPNVNYIDGMRQ